CGLDGSGSKRGDHLFSHWRPKQLESDCAELTSNINVATQSKTRNEHKQQHAHNDAVNYLRRFPVFLRAILTGSSMPPPQTFPRRPSRLNYQGCDGPVGRTGTTMGTHPRP